MIAQLLYGRYCLDCLFYLIVFYIIKLLVNVTTFKSVVVDFRNLVETVDSSLFWRG